MSGELTLWVAALRYYMGRSSYMVANFCDLLIKNWPELPSETKNNIRIDLEHSFLLQDQGALGADAEIAEWSRVRKLWDTTDEQTLKQPNLHAEDV